MSRIRLAMVVGMLAGLSVAVQAQTYQSAYRLSDREVKRMIRTVEHDAKTFRKSLDHALDKSRLDGTQREDVVNNRVKNFEEATKQLRAHFVSHHSADGDVQNVLDRSARIDEFMYRHSLDAKAQGDWSKLKRDLDQLASAYSVIWRWEQSSLPVDASATPYRASDREVEHLLNSTEKAADTFRKSLDHALDHSRFDGTAREDDINQFVKEFRDATKQLRDHFNGHTSVGADVETVLSRAARIDNFMMRHKLDRTAQRDWTTVKSDLERLATNYNVSWDWNRRIDWTNESR